MHATTGPRSTGTATPNPIDISSPSNSSNLGDAERGFPTIPHSVPISVRSVISALPTAEDETEMQPTSSGSSTANYFKHKTSQIFDAVMTNGKKKTPSATVAPALASLVDAYANSTIAAEIKDECDALRREANSPSNGNERRAPNGGSGAVSNELPDVALETSMLRGRKRASYGTQFRILSGRAFKNLYRDPALLTAHYTSAIGLAVICGLFYHNVT